jgi:hypothetical protein
MHDLAPQPLQSVSRASLSTTEHKPHRLKNGHPAHVFTEEDRRKAAAVTNEIRREKRALFEQARITRELEEMLARDEERRRLRREKRQARARIARYGY